MKIPSVAACEREGQRKNYANNWWRICELKDYLNLNILSGLISSIPGYTLVHSHRCLKAGLTSSHPFYCMLCVTSMLCFSPKKCMWWGIWDDIGGLFIYITTSPWNICSSFTLHCLFLLKFFTVIFLISIFLLFCLGHYNNIVFCDCVCVSLWPSLGLFRSIMQTHVSIDQWKTSDLLAVTPHHPHSVSLVTIIMVSS